MLCSLGDLDLLRHACARQSKALGLGFKVSLMVGTSEMLRSNPFETPPPTLTPKTSLNPQSPLLREPSEGTLIVVNTLKGGPYSGTLYYPSKEPSPGPLGARRLLAKRSKAQSGSDAGLFEALPRRAIATKTGFGFRGFKGSGA